MEIMGKAMKCTFFCEPAGFPTLGVEYLVAVLRNEGHEVDVIFDEVLYRPWQIQDGGEKFDGKLIKAVNAT
jgi:hypothetical protein